jgi:hypothetical protein
MKVWVEFAMVIAVVASLLAWGYHLGETAKQGEWDAAVLAQKKGEDAALKAAAEAISKIEVKSETIIQPLRTEIRNNSVYRECKHSDDSLRNLNALITGDESAGDRSVPEANAPH